MKLEILVFLTFCLSSVTTKKEDGGEAAEATVNPVRNNLGQGEEKTTFPTNLTDANQDGRIDEGDFIRGFSSSVNG